MHIAAPSFCPEAFPAVTVDSGSILARIGRSDRRPSTVASARGMFIAVDDGVGLAAGAGNRDGTNSSANLPASCAVTARRWERTASSSCSWREMPYALRRPCQLV